MGLRGDRRRFLGLLGGLGSLGLATAACAQVSTPAQVAPVSADQVMAAARASTPPTPTATTSDHGASHSAAQSVAEMDALHAAGIKAFPAPTAGQGNQPLAFTWDGDVKVFQLTASVIQWEVEPGRTVEAWAYNGMVPGPVIRVTEGDRVRIHVTNELAESTAVHWHGLYTPNSMDGVPFITQDPITPGQTFTYEFIATPAGSHMYHSHHNAAQQVSMGLMGAFLVEPREPADRTQVDHDYLVVMNDGPLGFTLNGKGFPATSPLKAKVGQSVRIRFMNTGLMSHPMHLHGMGMRITHKDGYPLPQPFMCDTLNLAPGERYDALVTCQAPGTWAFHCHILSHAESPKGMFGMVTALIIEP